MAVDQDSCSRQCPRVHAHTIVGPYFNSYEAFPFRALAAEITSELTKETTFEFLNIVNLHALNERLSCGDLSVDHENVFEVVVTWGWDGGTLVDLGGIEQVENREVLDAEHAIHSLQAQTALAIEKI